MYLWNWVYPHLNFFDFSFGNVINGIERGERRRGDRDANCERDAVVSVDNSARRVERGCRSCQGYDSLECKSRWEYFIDLDPPLRHICNIIHRLGRDANLVSLWSTIFFSLLFFSVFSV